MYIMYKKSRNAANRFGLASWRAWFGFESWWSVLLHSCHRQRIFGPPTAFRTHHSLSTPLPVVCQWCGKTAYSGG